MGSNGAKIYRKNEEKAIELVAKVLDTQKIERNKGVFDWLRGDKGMKLRVDAWFPEKKLVLEYHGAQHFKPNKLMDKKPGRVEQRRRYTEKRRELINKHGLKLLELKYDEPLEEEYIKARLIKLGYEV